MSKLIFKLPADFDGEIKYCAPKFEHATFTPDARKRNRATLILLPGYTNQVQETLRMITMSS